MALMPVATFLDVLRESQALEPAQLAELSGLPANQAGDVAALARILVQKGWLTPFQVNALAQGRAKELQLGLYRLVDRLGEGGMGQVYKARHRIMGRTVALKVIRKERLGTPNTVQRFLREVQTAAQLLHPNIVHAYDAGQLDNVYFFSMEFVEGRNLAQVVQASGPLPVAQACEYVRQAACGLGHAHEKGMIHRDIKPSNLLLTQSQDTPPRPLVKILDMGLARVQGPSEAELALTHAGTLIGTPEYVAPEQAMDSQSADIRSDLYSLGGTLYFLLTGRPPFQANSLAEMLLKHQMHEATPLEQLRRDVPPGLVAIVRRLLAKKPAERFQSPAELVEALATMRAGGAVVPPQRVTGVVLPGAPRDAVQAGQNTPAPDRTNTPTVEVPRRKTRAEFPRPRRQRSRAGCGAVLWLLFAVLAVGAVGAGTWFVVTGHPLPGLAEAKSTAETSPPSHVATKGATGTVGPTRITSTERRPEVRPEPALALTSVDSITLQPGETRTVEVKIDRHHFKGPVSIVLTGLPAEVKAQPVTIGADARTAQISLQAVANAADADRPVQIIATWGSLSAVANTRITVQKPEVLTKLPRITPPDTVTVKPPPIKPPDTTGKPPEFVGPPALVRKPVPSPPDQERATQKMRDTFKEDFAKTSAIDRLALAAKLIHKADESRDDDAAYFVLLREASNLGAQAGDLKVTQTAIDQLGQRFSLDTLESKLTTLANAAQTATTTALNRALVESSPVLVEDAMAVDNYPAALRVVAVIETAAKKSHSAIMNARAESQAKEVRDVQREQERFQAIGDTLKTNPDDPAANLAGGRFLCFLKGDWTRGLPLLAKGADAKLKELAAKELARPKMAKERAELGDAWFDYSESEFGRARMVVQRHALAWYQDALPGLPGSPLQARVETRVRALTDLLATGRPIEERLVGRTDGYGLLTELFVGANFERKAKTRIDPRVDFVWGPGAPDVGLPVDNFSIRWTGWLRAPRPGVYKFITIADDGVKLWLDDKLLIDKGGRQEVSVTLTGKPQPIKVDFFEGGGDARMSFYWLRPGATQEQVVPPEVLFHDLNVALKPQALPTPPRKGTGLLTELFVGRNLERRLRARIDTQVNFSYDRGVPADDLPATNFSIRWTGWIKAPKPGQYRLITYSDDGLRVWLDGKLVIDDWKEGGLRNVVAVEFSDKPQPLRIEYFQVGGPCYMSLHWEQVGGFPEMIVPAEAFFTDKGVAEKTP